MKYKNYKVFVRDHQLAADKSKGPKVTTRKEQKKTCCYIRQLLKIEIKQLSQFNELQSSK